ncbi:MAG: hypothetical protein K2J51_02725 [Alistipes sp.]|nr:hypothetical protein [Alistipes sp.]
MKKVCFMMAASICALATVACNSDGDDAKRAERSWNAEGQWVVENRNFDPAEVPALLLDMGMVVSREEWRCKNGYPYGANYALHFNDGWMPTRVVFFNDGTCRRYWYEEPGSASIGGMKYHEYSWTYDEESATVVTSYLGPDADDGFMNLKAQVKALTRDKVVFDGNLCGCISSYDGIYLRMAMRPESADNYDMWLENAQLSNSLDYGK